MDIVSHAVAGASVGMYYGKPLTGLLVGIAPDIVLGYKRLAYPNAAYNFTHSFAYLGAVTVLGHLTGLGAALVFYAALSHLLLDLPTHGPRWAPVLFWPHHGRYSMGKEWEWGSTSWQWGFIMLVCWSTFWIALWLLK